MIDIWRLPAHPGAFQVMLVSLVSYLKIVPGGWMIDTWHILVHFR